MRVLVAAASILALASMACGEEAAPPRFAPTPLDERCAVIRRGWSPAMAPAVTEQGLLDDGEETPTVRPRISQTVVLDGEAYLDPYRRVRITQPVVYEGGRFDDSAYQGGAVEYGVDTRYFRMSPPRWGGPAYAYGSPAHGGHWGGGGHPVSSGGGAGAWGGGHVGGGHAGGAGHGGAGGGHAGGGGHGGGGHGGRGGGVR